jgi:hypothetical protein
MQIRDEAIDKVYMDIIDIIGKNFDTDIAKAANIAEQITELINDLYEEEDVEQRS